MLVYEGLFLAVFALWAVFKAYNPEIAYTEKPMEVAFLNAILRSDRFPPLDPWLSGFSISYYYFGYLLVALLTRLSGVPSSIAYNLAVPLLMALTVTGAFSVVLQPGRRVQPASDARRRAAPSRGRTWRWRAWAPSSWRSWATGGPAGAAARQGPGQRRLLEVAGHQGPGRGAPQYATWYPSDGGWWWWRASRVINDTVLGVHREIIDEFPYFSFMLADLHPHVLALPFTLLALALALNLLRSPAEPADALPLGWHGWRRAADRWRCWRFAWAPWAS